MEVKGGETAAAVKLKISPLHIGQAAVSKEEKAKNAGVPCPLRRPRPQVSEATSPAKSLEWVECVAPMKELTAFYENEDRLRQKNDWNAGTRGLRVSRDKMDNLKSEWKISGKKSLAWNRPETKRSKKEIARLNKNIDQLLKEDKIVSKQLKDQCRDLTMELRQDRQGVPGRRQGKISSRSSKKWPATPSGPFDMLRIEIEKISVIKVYHSRDSLRRENAKEDSCVQFDDRRIGFWPWAGARPRRHPGSSKGEVAKTLESPKVETDEYIEFDGIGAADQTLTNATQKKSLSEAAGRKNCRIRKCARLP